MKYSQAELGRVFILRLEDGDRIPDVIEDFAFEKEIEAAAVQFLGGADKGSKVIVGPEDGAASEPEPLVTSLPGVSEAAGVGTLFQNEVGQPVLHLHSAFGRGGKTITGCNRAGVDVWHIGEVIIMELKNSSALRKKDPETGFELLEVDE